ncbi:hypothetical protein COCSUDRAFT_46564 [Coccomyxa subellipsoidea C-169]|uniref:Uncharacterized protein n=1 Tax=Coccomyxa subellipsoidea (strain C-169) TaxID=574566 RepID=I0Z309_COCSC|nr:hypothetical protein COCSUDRAFT_46564 [Coccomyxa subellipsoidea C-169]EIE25028.1 hypothetical protein COCSUDRAFT_46564 [Coccomyxa subellipsoidea C-169]|eukprot:XP_005649572.1 hypothetical protein COCSUDRAFT_46564 [Coccomyxa subellipsoidea C-169]
MMSVAALVAVLLQALLDAFMPGRESDKQRAERLQQDLSRYQGRDRAKRLEKELLLQRRKYEAVVSMFTRAKDELQRMVKTSSAAQVDLREMKAERRAQRAAQLETLHERERLSAELTTAEQTSSQLRRQLDAARAAGAEARAASSALTQRLASASAQLSTLRSGGAEASQKLQSAEAALQNTRQQSAALQEANAGLQGKVAGLSGERGKLAGRCAELEADLAAASAEVDELRQLLDGVMTEKAALAARCSSLESQAHCLEADYGQLRNWLEEVIEEKAALEARIEDLEGAQAEVLDEKLALEGWVRGSVAEQTETCTRLKSIQAQSQEQREELVTHNALLAALLVQLAQRDAELADLRSATSARQPSLARKPSQKLLRALSVPGARANPPSPKQDTLLTPAQPPMTSARSMTSAVTSSRAAEPCTPSKEPPLPPHAAERRAACNSAAAVTDPTESPERTLAAGSAGARKRLCMGEGVNSQGDGVGMEEAVEAVRDAEASGQLSSAVSIEADAEQVSPEQPPQSWKLLAAEKPLSICADCAMPPTPEKHAIVQVDAHGRNPARSLDDFSIKARPAMEIA